MVGMLEIQKKLWPISHLLTGVVTGFEHAAASSKVVGATIGTGVSQICPST
jgi:hypothetical protein